MRMKEQYLFLWRGSELWKNYQKNMGKSGRLREEIDFGRDCKKSVVEM
jgi:hypothetical protein